MHIRKESWLFFFLSESRVVLCPQELKDVCLGMSCALPLTLLAQVEHRAVETAEANPNNLLAIAVVAANEWVARSNSLSGRLPQELFDLGRVWDLRHIKRS